MFIMLMEYSRSMMPSLVFWYAVRWGIVGSAVFSVLVFMFFRTGFVFTARDQEGKLKRDMPLIGYAAMSIVLFGVLGIQMYGFSHSVVQVAGFVDVFVLNYALYLFLLLYDTLVVDILVLCIWKPGFLRVPEGEGFTSIRHHVGTLLPGSVIGFICTLISTAIIVYL